jgi:hypothetical protein
MYYNSCEVERLAIIEMQCPICDEIANIRIGRETDYFCLLIVFNFWMYGKVIATCGNCHESFEIKKKYAYDLLDSVNVPFNRSNLKKNLVSLSAPIIIFYLICIVVEMF